MLTALENSHDCTEWTAAGFRTVLFSTPMRQFAVNSAIL